MEFNNRLINININKFIIFLLNIKYKLILTSENIQVFQDYIKIQINLNLTFNNKISKKIRVGIYEEGLKNGGRERLTCLLVYYLNKVNIFDIFLFTKLKKEENEYFIPENINRIILKNFDVNGLIQEIYKKKIDIFIYQFTKFTAIEKLNEFKKLKIMFYQHQCSLYWIYRDYSLFKYIYKSYKKSKYVVNLLHFESDYLFKKWGIRSILMNNYISYEYNSVIQSDLSSKIILMIGRGNDIFKRFEIGIQAMEYIKEEIPECEMKIISNISYIYNLKDLVSNLNLEDFVKFVGYTSTPEIFYKNASLHIFPSISESFGLVLSETKLYGIPTILVGIDYISTSKGGTIIIYEDKPESITKETLRIFKNNKYMKKLGKEGRNSIKAFNNNLLLNKWIKLILSIYNGDKYYTELIDQDEKISEIDAIKILENQLKLIKEKNKVFKNVSINDFVNFTFLENFNI